MKSILLSVAVVFVAAQPLFAQELSAAERERAVKFLEKTRDDFLAATKDLTAAQWNFKPATNRWSAAQIAEHIASSEDFVMDTIRDRVLKAPPRPEGDDVKAIDDFIMKAIADRSQKVQAPEPLTPKDRFGSPQESIKHFKEARARTITFLQESKELRKHAIDSPLDKKLDGYQWILFAGAHTERHLKQLQELKDGGDFPKR